MYSYVFFMYFMSFFIVLSVLCASGGGAGEIFVKKMFWTIPLSKVEKLAPLTKSKLNNIQNDNENKMILNNIPFPGGEVGPTDQMYKDQHPLHGAQLCQVGAWIWNDGKFNEIFE